MSATEYPTLAHGLSFPDLYSRDGLERLDAAFRAHLTAQGGDLAQRLDAGRADPAALDRKAEAGLLLDLAPHLEDFLAELFGIQAEVSAASARHHALAPLFAVKRKFVQRVALKQHGAEAAGFDGPALRAELEALFGAPFSEEVYANRVSTWLEDETGNAASLDVAARYAAWAALQEPAIRGVLFRQPGKHDPEHLVPVEADTSGPVTRLHAEDAHIRQREGFGLTDQGADLKRAMDEINYCIYCHNQGRDSCSKGMTDRKTGAIQVNPLGREMLGCPLEEKISEFQWAKGQGMVVSPLAIITVDNPMCAGTGHRICNDCMVGCVYQNQNRDPVNIPEAESRTLKDVLELPWGFEIYSLLTRWNPLNLKRPLPRPDSGRKVLVVGLGPAGYTLAHHLLNDGHTVVAIDGLKIEPLDPALSGVDALGNRHAFRPIRDIAEIREDLGKRLMGGFGGVAEYGITVRWDKNFLTILRLMLERRAAFAMLGGVRFGGTVTVDEAAELGFDHVALCMGAGKPTLVDMDNRLARGVRQASDFLMALQLTGAARSDLVANLQLRLPVVVIGGGLTAIDTATEALAYYPVQVETFLSRYETLVAELGESRVRAGWSEEEAAIAAEFIGHAKAIRAERSRAAAAGEEPDLIRLLEGWGGSTLVYRRRLQDSPAYRNNHEEVFKAFEEGIRYAENLSPVAVELDRWGHASGLRVKDKNGNEALLPARAVIVAAGTVPNTTLAREEAGIHLDGRYFQAIDLDGNPVKPERRVKPQEPQVLMTRDAAPVGMSFFGDLHPSFAGNVVAAMASAKQGYPLITREMERRPANPVEPAALLRRINDQWRATVVRVERLTPTIVEVVVRAPAAARHFQPGQFYRLQNFERLAPRTGEAVLAMEGLALTGAWTDPDQGLLSLIVLEMGGSSDFCVLLKPGEPVIVMGPTGTPTEIPEGETVLLAGGGLGNAVLFSIGQALRARGSRVLYAAGYRNAVDRFKIEEIEKAADAILWCVDSGAGFTPTRSQDRAFVGNIVEALRAYAEGRLGETAIKLADVDRIIAIGSDRMMAAVAAARHGVLAPHLKQAHVAIGSINSPMQCMMKEICAQCLQIHKDPATGEETVVFSCFNQDQPLDNVDFHCLSERLRQSGVQEKLTKLWIDRALTTLGARPVAAE